ncbi:PIN-like domain-containing protein [Streptomyces sp. NPDC088341]|uniref:PIN-like domain-containing protein n=1 Tax=Streptomyces sp. NPDC088341 TaxID=3154870 RepID=UPI00344822DA
MISVGLQGNDGELVMPQQDDSHPSNGLFDDFEAYRTPTSADYRRVLTTGMVVLDTNVLLDLYRYNRQTRDDLLAVLIKIQTQLWVPRQVVTEFWAGRDLALMTRRDSTRDALTSLEKTARGSVDAVTNWAKSIGLDKSATTELTSVLENAYRHVRGTIEFHADDTGMASVRDTTTDPVIEALKRILAGRVGSALSDPDHAEAVREAERRAKEKIPPGYRDDGKPNGRGAGDYLLWEQTLREAQHREVDVLLVTRDVKEDWWRRTLSVTHGPRPELARELKARSGRRLFMTQPQDLLRLGREVLDVTVQDESVEQATRLERPIRRRHLAQARAQSIARADGVCENPNCASPPFSREASAKLLQVTFLQSLAEGGKDDPENMIVLCPNCRALWDYGRGRGGAQDGGGQVSS